jgi:hypothetical protein
MIPRFSLWRLALVAALLGVAAPRASAEPIVWSYQNTVTATGPNVPPPFMGVPQTYITGSADGFASVSLFGTQGTETGSPLPPLQGINVTGAYLAGVPGFLHGDVGRFTAAANPFDVAVRLTDAGSGTSGTLLFHGGINGTASYRNTFLIMPYANPTKSLQLGGHLYTVTMDGNTWNGGGMQVQVRDVPEPSTLALAVLGLSGLGVRAWRRRRARRNAHPAGGDSFSASPGLPPQVAQ